MSDIETLLGYAQRFLERVSSPSFTLDEFSNYIKNLDQDISALPEVHAAKRISSAFEPVRQCGYFLRCGPDMKDRFVVPQVANLVEVIRHEIHPTDTKSTAE
jgi:hypothetical protein